MKTPFVEFESYKIPRRVSQAYFVLLNDRDSLQNLLSIMDDLIVELNERDMNEQFSACPAPDVPVTPHLQEKHRRAVDFAETMLFGRIVDSLTIYLVDVCALLDLTASGLIASDGSTRFCDIGVSPKDPLAARLRRLSKAPFPKLLEELQDRGVTIPSDKTLDVIEQIRSTRNQYVHHRGIAGILISRLTPQKKLFTVEEDILQPLGANANVYIAAMEHVLSFCAMIDVQAAALAGLPTRKIRLMTPRLRPGKKLRSRPRPDGGNQS